MPSCAGTSDCSEADGSGGTELCGGTEGGMSLGGGELEVAADVVDDAERGA